MSAYLPILVKLPEALDHTDSVAVAAYLVRVLEALEDGGIEAEADDAPEPVRH